jgi:hypothetical protein
MPNKMKNSFNQNNEKMAKKESLPLVVVSPFKLGIKKINIKTKRALNTNITS